ncbi:MAG TPA: DHHA1 domain-containing protein [Thermoanaerobaculia bacterium]|nr:DHHA1 domain-containing protein [Thermoanaerobaculia bacterium]
MITEATRDRCSSLAELVRQQGRGGRWLVLTHDNPDPDALASAILLSRVLRGAWQQRVTVAYGGMIGRAENREMVRSLHLAFSHVRHLNFKNYARFALVDTQPQTGNNQLPAGIVPDLVIDHHPLRKATQLARLFDVRPRYGATATILAEYMLAAGVKPSHGLATALIYAIRAETQDFAREFAGPDKAIFDLFFPQADHRLLARIQNPRLPLSYFGELHEALERLESVDSLIASHLGVVEHPDIVPEIADLLLRMEGKTWSLVTGYFGDRLYLSIRTTNPRADAGSLMRRLLGRKGKGGGHGRTAGGWIDAGKLDDAGRRKLQRAIGEKLARELKKNPEKIAPLVLRAPRAEAPPAVPIESKGEPGGETRPAAAVPAAASGTPDAAGSAAAVPPPAEGGTDRAPPRTP